MKHRLARLTAAVLALTALASAAQAAPAPKPAGEPTGLIGAWRAHISFTDGAFADEGPGVQLRLQRRRNTRRRSSNYDAAPPVPPAYGIWRRTGARTFQSKYVFYVTKSPASFDDIKKGGGWAPDGHGVFTGDHFPEHRWQDAIPQRSPTSPSVRTASPPRVAARALPRARAWNSEGGRGSATPRCRTLSSLS